jgi:hypothetical protein
MATQLWFSGSTTAQEYASGVADAKIDGTSVNTWTSYILQDSQGSGNGQFAMNTVTGPTSGIQATSGGGDPLGWYSPPVAAAVTISGAITWNLWGSESNMSANAAINGQIEKIDGATGAFTLIDKTARVTELATTAGVNNFAETPASGVALKKGDRLRIRIFIGDAGTMATGFQGFFDFNGATPGADFDSWVSLTETVTFLTEPAGTQVFLTNTASPVSTASTDYVAWTTRGGGAAFLATNTVNGPTSPIQITQTAGGTVVDWFTNTLPTMTLSGGARCNIRATTSSSANGVAVYVEIARVAGDGTSPTVWAVGQSTADINSTEAASSVLLAGDDLAITSGQRLRIRVYIHDRFGSSLVGSTVMATAHTGLIYINGTTPGATGDSYVTFTSDLTASAPTFQPSIRNRRMLAQLLAQ